MARITVGHSVWWKTPLIILVGVVAGAAAAYGAYNQGLKDGAPLVVAPVTVKAEPVPEKEDFAEEYQNCKSNLALTLESSEKRIKLLDEASAKLRTQLVETKSATTIDKNALNWAQTDIKRLQSQKMKLNAELEFMRSIVYPQASRTGLRLYEVELRKSDAKEVYHYQVTLLQTLKDNSRTRVAEGAVHIKVHGIQNKKAVVLPLRKISMQNKAALNFSFKHHQNLVGDLKLPKSFVPSRIEFKVVPRRRRAGSIKQTYEWSEVVS